MPIIIRMLCCAAVLGICTFKTQSSAEDTTKGQGFREIVRSHNEAAVREVIEYLKQNSDADDASGAYQWLFETALNEGMEAEVTEIAAEYLQEAEPGDQLQGLALSVHCLGLARSGKSQESLELYEKIVRASRFRPSNSLLDLAEAISTRAQLNGDLPAAKEAYERLSAAFFLNEPVKEFCALRLGKLELVGQDAPAVAGMAFGGGKLDTDDLAGKVVLIDFWATNCAPCLTAFPGMKELYAEFHPQGFEIVGISLDDDTRIVEDFQQRWKLPWPLLVDQPQLESWREQYHAKKIPSIYLVNKEGKIVSVDLNGKDLHRAVKKLLTDD